MFEQRNDIFRGRTDVRPVPVAIVVSMIVHVGAFAWVVPGWKDPGPVVVPPAPEPAPALAAAAEPISVAIVTLDPTDGASPKAATDAAPRVQGHASITTSGSASATHTDATTAHPTEPGPGTRTGPSRMSMRRPRGTGKIPDEFVDNFLLHSKPPGDRELLPDEKLAEEIREAWRAGDWLGLAALREQQRKLDLKPSGGGTYKADKNGFDVNVAKGGMTHLKDKPTFDATDAMMRAVGIDPYASEKLRVLDRTREHRAIMQHRATRERLAHSGQLMQSHISRLWASTADLAARKQGLFELWDDCAETGSDELVAGGAEARKLVIAWIQLKLRDADAYTADELAQLNAKRKSQERFEP
jgi:hypothetical protein